MLREEGKVYKYRDLAHQWVFVLIPFMLCLNERLSTILVIFYIFGVLLQNFRSSDFLKPLQKTSILLLGLLFLLHLASLMWTDDLKTGLFVLEKKIGLLVLPVAIVSDKRIQGMLFDRSLFAFVLGCVVALLYCVIMAGWSVFNGTSSEAFFYHALGKPLGDFNAIFFSWYLFIAILFIKYYLEKRTIDFWGHKVLAWGMIVLLVVGMVLLSSKLFLILTIGYLGYTAYQELNKDQQYISGKWGLGAAVLIIGIGVFGLGSVNKRFMALTEGSFKVLQQEHFTYDTSFNSLTLRLLLLKFGGEILAQEKAWWSGVGVGDAQHEMDKMIVHYNVYHGNPQLGDVGYLGYNYHNQFVEFWMQIGILGMLLWGGVVFTGFKIAWSQPIYYPLYWFMIAVLLFSCIESFLERQRGVLLFAYFFPLLMLRAHEKNT